MTNSLIGKISSAHGIKGDFKIIYYSSTSLEFKQHKIYLDKNGNELDLTFRAEQKKFIIANSPNIDSRDKAEALAGTEIFTKLEEISKDTDEFYYSNLVNCEVRDPQNKILGKISAVENFGAGDIIEIEFSNKEKKMFSFNQIIFSEINIEDKFVIFNAPEEL